jgi:hypothetical protein
MTTCPNCGNETAEGAVFCDQCGTRLPGPEMAVQETASDPAGGSVICPACGAGNVPGEAFCDFCGSPLEAPVPTAEPTPELEPVSTEVELEAAPEPKAEAEAAPPVEEKPTCPACGAEVLPGEAFCANCGASLAQASVSPEPVIEAEAEPEPPVEEAPLEPEPVAVEAPVAEAPAEEAPAEAVSEEEPPPPTPLAAALTCPACGVEVESGDRFCSNCGAVLEGAPAPVEAAPAPSPPPSPPSVGPRLVVAASGAEIPLPVGDELLIGREDPVSGIFPDVDLTPHGGDEGGVSRQHARLIIEGGNYFVEDLNSTNFTFVNQQKLAPKTRQPLSDGDEIRCGRVALVLKT